jgi:hypothetical protein
VAYAANQLSRLGPGDSTYGVLNVAGAAMLAVAAVISAVWGFVVLEGTWAVVSLVALVRLTRRRAARVAGEPGETPTATPDHTRSTEQSDSPPTSGVQR